MTRDQIIRLAIRWWESAPAARRTREHLAALLDQGCDVYAIPAADRPAMLQEAWEQIPNWKKGKV